jgi:hypothetical protein
VPGSPREESWSPSRSRSSRSPPRQEGSDGGRSQRPIEASTTGSIDSRPESDEESDVPAANDKRGTIRSFYLFG